VAGRQEAGCARVQARAGNSGRDLESVSQARSRQLAHLPAKRAAREKEAKAPMVNLPHHQEAERLLQPSVARGSQSAERKKQRKNHPRRGHNNPGAIVIAAPERKGSGAAFFSNELRFL
jgi:hypothetical protein